MRPKANKRCDQNEIDRRDVAITVSLHVGLDDHLKVKQQHLMANDCRDRHQHG